MLRLYYAATALFLFLDYVIGINIRLAFLDSWPLWRAAYYLFCFLCLVLIVSRPGLDAWVGLVESLISLSLLIVGTASRVIVVSDDMIESGRAPVNVSEIANFALVGTILYIACLDGLRRLRRQSGAMSGEQ